MPHTWFVRLCVSTAACAIFASCLLAQDVTLTPLEWTQPDDPPEVLPAFKRRPAIRSFPDEVKSTTAVGYVVMDFTLDEKGRIEGRDAEASMAVYQRTVDTAENWSEYRFKPALRQGKPVPAQVRFAVIFNPATAAIDLADASPRLLEPAVVLDERASDKQTEYVPPYVVWATVSISADGKPVKLSDAPPNLVELIERSLGRWSFAPARKAGQPVAADIVVPFVIKPVGPWLGAAHVPPKPIRREPPMYPMALRQHGIRGEVLVDFVVDIEGRVRSPRVVRSLNPYFDEAALAAMRRWKFAPARVDGRPVNTRMQQPISFSLDGEADGGEDGYSVTRRGDLSKLPEELRYDTPARLKSVVNPVYPYELLRQKVSGSAEVAFVISQDGQVTASRVNSADKLELGLALQAAVEHFAYEPALKNGLPVQSVRAFEQKFSPSNEQIVTQEQRDALRLEQKHPERIVKATTLDEPLKAWRNQRPVYPTVLREGGKPGQAVVEFLIHEDGSVRLPRIISATEPSFGYAAVQAVSLWQFAPPKSGGKPVTTRARMPFAFAFTERKASDAAAQPPEASAESAQ